MAHKRFPLLVPLLLAFASLAAAQAQDKVQLVEDVPGPTLEASVTNGLVRALAQVKGLRVDAALVLRKRHESESLEITSGMEKWFAKATADDVSHGSILQETAGLVRTYEIVKQEQDPTTRDWKVSLKVTIPIYDAAHPRPGARPTLAVLGFRTPTHPFELGGVRVSAQEMNDKLRDQSEIRFLQSRKFIVLDRKYQAELGAETARIEAGGMAFDEQVKLGNRLGADYIVVGDIAEFSWDVEPFEVKVTGYKGTRVSAAYDLAVKLIDVATGQTVWSDNVRRLFSDQDLKNLSPEDQQQNLRIADFLAGKAAMALARQVVDGLYPIKVAAIEDRRVVLAAGAARVRVGELFMIHVVGKGIKDPDTGELIGSAEKRVATISVVSVQEGLAYAEVQEGDLAQVEVGALCRRLDPRPE
jgi:hypothetical protein